MSETRPDETMGVDEEVVRDLRHSVGNHFHKLYYWADRIGSEEEASTRAEQIEELNGALRRFQEYLELGLRYFEPDHADPTEMAISQVASASASVLRGELPSTEVTVGVSAPADGCAVRLDPQRFSLVLRLLARLLGGAGRKSFACHLANGGDGRTIEVTIEASGGEAPLEIPVMEWAIARKIIAMQGGALRLSPGPDDSTSGCVLTLPLGSLGTEEHGDANSDHRR